MESCHPSDEILYHWVVDFLYDLDYKELMVFYPFLNDILLFLYNNQENNLLDF